MRTKKRIQSVLAVLLIALTLLVICPISAFASSKVPTTTQTVPTAAAYCRQHNSCQGKHVRKDCPGPQRLTATRNTSNVAGVPYTIAATKPTTSSATTVTVTSTNKDTYSYTVSADNQTITERKNGVVTRTTTVAAQVNNNAAARTTKNKKDGAFSYQKLDSTETKMNIWLNNGTKTPITRTKANTESYFAYQAAVEGNISAVNASIAWGVGGGLAIVAVGVATFATAGLAGAAAAAMGAKIGAAVIGVGSASTGIAGGALVTSLEKCATTYQDAKKYYYILKG
jgi:hypothetical protein